MPDLDGGHGFLTVLLPLDTRSCTRADGTITSAPHAVRELLAALPTAQHSPDCAASGRQSPFAASRATHFARFAVIDQPAFNGRMPSDAILNSLPLLGKDPLVAQPVDVLPRAHLLFCADFDRPPGGREEALRSYVRDLCACTPEVWNAVLAHCAEAPADRSAASAAEYLLRHRVETTMPFNDYPVGAPGGTPPILPPLALALVVGLAVFFALGRASPTWPWIADLAVAALGALLALGGAVWVLGARGAPAAAGTDLPTVLKALHVQAAFTRLALTHQGSAPGVLQAAFAAFIEDVRPDDLVDPDRTQAPGVVP